MSQENLKTIHPTVAHQVEKIEAVVCKVFGVEIEDIHSPKRSKISSRARFAVYLLLSEKCFFPASMIGRIYDRDHTSVIHGIKEAKNLGYPELFAKYVDKWLINPIFFPRKPAYPVENSVEKL